MLSLGICARPEQADVVASSYDYIELPFATALDPLRNDADFAEDLARLKDLPLPARACNILLPGLMRIVGPEVDGEAIRRYLIRGLARAYSLGIERVVFGSGAARRVPEAFSRDAAWDQLVAFCRLCSDLAYPGLEIAIEPLNRQECNIINGFPEAVALARDAGCTNVGVVADIYHMQAESEPLAVLWQGSDLLKHVHVADTDRRYPGSGSNQLPELFATLDAIQYQGSVSVECRWGPDFASEAHRAARFLRSILGPASHTSA
ncbi:MAG: sugar phosphate isomerase/epimerase [Chloroflexi bacterium]|nr:sugar phosphate isomerase/epimerase [Chloroflexota bacterium]